MTDGASPKPPLNTNDPGPLVVRSAMVEAEHAALVSMVEKAGSGAFAVGHCIAIVEKADRVAAAALEGDGK